MASIEMLVVRRMWTNMRRAYPWTFFVSTVFAGVVTIGLAYLTFRLVGNGTVSAEFVERATTSDYLSYVATGTIAYALFVRTLLWVARCLVTEEREQTLLALLATPTPVWRYLIGQGAFAILATIAECGTLIVVTLALGIHLTLPAPLTASAGLIVYVVCIASMAAAVLVVMLYSRDTFVTQNTLFIVVGLISGFTFPTAYLPGVVMYVADLLPVTSGVRVLRSCLAGDASVLGSTTMVSAMVTSLIFLVGAGVAYPWARDRAIARSL